MSHGKRFTIDDAFEDEPMDEVKANGSGPQNSPSQSAGGPQKLSNYGGIDNESAPRTKQFEDAVSRDSDSLIYNSSTYPNKYCYCWHHPQVQENWRVVLAAVIMLVIGIVLLSVATIIQLTPNSEYHQSVFFIAGFICFIPGAYHVVYIYLAARGYPGYSFYNLSLFN